LIIFALHPLLFFLSPSFLSPLFSLFQHHSTESSFSHLLFFLKCFCLPEYLTSQGKQEIDTSLPLELTADEEISRFLAPADELQYHESNILGVKFSDVFEMKPNKIYPSLHGKSPCASVSDLFLAPNMSKVGQLCSSDGLDFGADHGENTGLRNDGICCSSLLGECEKTSRFLALQNDKAAVSMGPEGDANHKSKISFGQ
jgi:hypothetical protein